MRKLMIGIMAGLMLFGSFALAAENLNATVFPIADFGNAVATNITADINSGGSYVAFTPDSGVTWYYTWIKTIGLTTNFTVNDIGQTNVYYFNNGICTNIVHNP